MVWLDIDELSKLLQILVVGFFHQEYRHLAKSNVYCVCGDTCITAETIQVGVFRIMVSPHNPGSVSFYLSIDCSTPISQVLTFEFRSPAIANLHVREDKSEWNMFRIQIRLAFLLFSTSKSLDILSSKVSPSALKEGKKFALKYSNLADSWLYFIQLIESGKIPFERAKDSLFELSIKSRLKEWLLERIVEGSKISERDAEGQGVLHLCAILGYTWAVYPYSCCGLSLDFRDKIGWTALHWAAYFGRHVKPFLKCCFLLSIVDQHMAYTSYFMIICLVQCNPLRFCSFFSLLSLSVQIILLHQIIYAFLWC